MKFTHEAGEGVAATDRMIGNLVYQLYELMEKEIDQLVYQLYGLTEDEVKIVEGSS